MTFLSSDAVGSIFCNEITIVGDDIMEGDEVLTLAVTVANTNDVIVGGNIVTVIILDNDGRW